MLDKIVKKLFKDKPIKLNYLVDAETEELQNLLAKTTKKLLLSKGQNNNQLIFIRVNIDEVDESTYTYTDIDAIELKLQKALINKPKSSYGTDFNKGIEKALKIVQPYKQKLP